MAANTTDVATIFGKSGLFGSKKSVLPLAANKMEKQNIRLSLPFGVCHDLHPHFSFSRNNRWDFYDGNESRPFIFTLA
jgi:hypothetical protein